MSRNWRNVHYRKNLGDVRGRRFQNELISECHVTNVAGAYIVNCDCRGTHLDIDDVRKLLGVTVTLDCYTFDGLKLSELALDTFLYLLTHTEDNDYKREQVRSLIDPVRRSFFDRAFELLGR